MTSPILRWSLPLALLVLLLWCAPAPGAEYVQHACHLPDGTPVGVDGFSAGDSPDVIATNECPTGGGLTLTLPDGTMSSSLALNTWTYTPAPNTSLVHVRLTRRAHNISAPPPTDTRRTANVAIGDDYISYCAWNADCDESVGIDHATTGELTITAACNANPCFGPSPGPGSWAVDAIALTLRDSSVPQFVAAPHGDLFEAGPISGTRTVSVDAQDDGGGIRRVGFVIDGALRESATPDGNHGLCEPPFTARVPCPPTVSSTLSLDTTVLTDGNHSIRVFVEDVTGQNRAMSDPVTVEVRNTADPVTGGSGGVSAAPTVKIIGRAFNRGSVTLRNGETRALRGRLVDIHDNPVGGVDIDVISTLAVPGAPARTIATVTTDNEGLFQLRIPAGPSRTIVLAPRARTAVGTTVKVLVKAPIRLMASRQRLRNGQQLFLTAYLLDASAQPGSADVAFQVRIASQWRTFATRRLDRKGRARIAHRFKVTFHRMTYRFRAIVVGRQTFPFENGTSRPVAVRVN